MKKAIILFVFCMTGLILMTGISWSEEASWYDPSEDWIVRVYTAPAGPDYSVTLEVVDTGNKMVTDTIKGMATNPLQIVGTAASPDVSLAFDEDSATAYVTYTTGGGVTLQPVPDIARYAGVIVASPNPVLFGSVRIGEMKKKTITIKNTGASPLNFTAIGTTEAPFITATTCATGTPVAAGKSCKIVVRFAPTAAIGYSGNLLINSANGNVNIKLIGAGQ